MVEVVFHVRPVGGRVAPASSVVVAGIAIRVCAFAVAPRATRDLDLDDVYAGHVVVRLGGVADGREVLVAVTVDVQRADLGKGGLVALDVFDRDWHLLGGFGVLLVVELHLACGLVVCVWREKACFVREDRKEGSEWVS